MAQLFDSESNEVEAFTEEEVNEKIKEAKEEAIAEANQLREEEINTLTTEKEEIEQSLESLKTENEDLKSQMEEAGGEGDEGDDDKNKNWERLRKAKEASDKKVKELEEKMAGFDKKIEEKVGELSSKQLEDHKEELLKDFDKDTKEKIDFHYKSFQGVPANKKEMDERVKNAVILATGGQPKNPFSGSNVSSTGGIGKVFEEEPKEKLSSPDSADVGKKLGLSDKDMKEGGLI
jgi:chromosome segregation ATPase